MKPLPVPALDDTLERTLSCVDAVIDDAAPTRRLAHDFAVGAGPRIQAALADYAAECAAAGSSWLAGRWLDGYLTTREPLPLSSNVCFQIRLDTDAHGLERLAAVVHAAARVHLPEAAGRTGARFDARGNELAAEQWNCLRGGVRVPGAGRDTVEYGPRTAADREVVVFCGGRAFALPVSDGGGRVVPRSELAAGFARILDTAHGSPADDRPGGAPGFTDASYRGSGDAEFRAWLAEPANAAVHERLARALFCVSLPATADASAAGAAGEAGAAAVAGAAEDGTSLATGDAPKPDPDARRLRTGAFASGHYWAYKPLTYELAADDSGWAALLVEHSTVDGATLVQTVADIQAELAGAGGADVDGADGAGIGAGEGRDVGNRAPQELSWTRNLPAPEHEPPRLEIRRAARPRPRNIKLSADAYAQLVMTVAQLSTYGRVRAVYEAVDMREYAAGRTECLRPVTPAAVAFARALLAGSADRAGLKAALDAHRDWVKACKTGRGVDRHLWALGWTAQELGEDPGFLRDPGLAAARTDFLSTTSVGSDAQVVRYAFAPTTPDGFGICYTPLADAVEYTVTFGAGAEHPEAFLEALGEAAARLAEFITGLDAA
ncbi:choline/carnitine O-acyltransferase [Corynebacterium frankenforstense]|uniref:choline/carnitine O-acyltransferase n=1 Tax=Corynebacterium frankenforstense TaxID=1230998 RepID=UPI000950BED4|nr:choline/carnitine O-acyltransferase [Corynebacterium frankenforstense]